MEKKLFKSEKLPFVELRYIYNIISCDKKHQHDELTLTAIKTGNININFNNKSDVLKPGEISIVNPNEVHSATLSNTESSGCYVLYLDKNWCNNIQKTLFDNVSFIGINNSLIQNKKIYNDFIKLCDNLLCSDLFLIEKEEELINFINNLFLEFCTVKELKNEDENRKKLELALKIKNYICENIDDDILLEDIANNMKLSKVHILRIFKKEYGLPIHSYILNKKVHLSKDLLSKNIPISEVAQLAGFFDQSHLNKSFKRVFQLTPKEYQKNIIS